MKNFFYLLFAFLLCGFALQRSVAQTTVTVGGGASIVCPAVPTATWTTPPTGITFSNWSRGSGVTCASAANAISGSGFNTANTNASFTGNKYYSVTITADATHAFILSSATWISTVSAGSATLAVGYSNNGGATTLLGSSATVTGSNVSSTFSGATGITVLPGTSLVLYFVPSNTGAAGTTVRWVNGSTITLTALTVSGTTNHGDVCVNASGTPITYTITNSGSVAVSGVSVTSNNSQFVVSNLSSTSIPAGGTATYDVTFTPTTTGAQNADITVACTTFASTTTTSALTGTGVSTIAGLTNDGPICSGSTVTFTATPTGATSYVWNAGGSTTNTTIATPTANTTYTVTITGTNGCTGVASSTVTVNANPTLSLAPSCAGGAGTGVLTPTFTAGAGGSPSYNPASLSSLADGTYTVTVTESGSGCTAIASGTISCATSCGAIADAPVGTITPASFCQTGGALTGSTAASTAPTSFDYELVYLLVDDATGIIVSNDFTVDALIAPDNNGTTVKTYSVYALVYESAQGVDITNGTTTITVGDADVIKDLDGDPLAATPSATACMDLSPAAATTVAVNPKPTLTDDIDDLNCSGTSAAIDLQSNVSGTTVTWTAALTSGTATGFSDNATPTTVDNAASTNEINTTLTNTGTTNAVVTYTITPTANGCAGSNYVVPLTIFPPLVISTAPVCNGATLYDVTFAMTGGGGSGYSVSNNATGTLNYSSPDANGTVTAIPLATTLTLDVTDDEGCVATKNTVLNDCNASITISDPCTCNGDQSANGAQDGTFGETVTVTGTGTGQTWTVIAVSTLSGSGTLPTATVGTVLTAGIGNNYVTTFSHTDDTGYSLVIEGPNALVGAGVVGSPQAGNQQLTISNLCQYPEAVFSPTFNATYCLPVSPITLAAYEVNSMAGSMTYSGTDVSGTTFAPTIAQPYTVTATFTSTAGTGLGGTVLAPATPDNACSTQVFQNTTVANCPGCAPVGGTW